MNEITSSILRLLDDRQAGYKLLTHGPCATSEESARRRAESGGTWVTGAKALLVKMSFRGGMSAFNVFVLSGAERLNVQAVHGRFPTLRKLRFVTPDEMAATTGGVQPGAMPPFAKPIFPALDGIFFDAGLVAADELVGFNAGDHCVSLIVSIRDLVKAASPSDIFPFAEDKEAGLCPHNAPGEGT